jgi:acyl-homoserine lactone acylase PvdQ
MPHVTASSERDAFFLQGFVSGIDRMFSMVGN